MTQSEKQDVILRYLYAKRDDGKEYSIKNILEESGIATNYQEVARLADKLKQDKLIELNDLSSQLKKAKINARGVEYSEKDSYI